MASTDPTATGDELVIVPVHHERDFTIIDNSAIRDKRLSFKARGLHHLLLSLPAGWRIESKRLATQFSEHDGRDAVRAALVELEAHRYVATVRQQGAAGRFQTVTYVYETPALNPHEQPTAVRRRRSRKSGDGAQPHAKVLVAPKTENPASVRPASENPASQEVPIEEEIPLPPAANDRDTLTSSVGGRRPPTPHQGRASNDHRRAVPTGGARAQGANPRALGRNPRALAQQAAEVAEREEARRRGLENARAYGERMTSALTEPAWSSGADCRAALEADRARGSGTWDAEQIDAVVDAVEQCLAARETQPPAVEVDTPADARQARPRRWWLTST